MIHSLQPLAAQEERRVRLSKLSSSEAEFTPGKQAHGARHTQWTGPLAQPGGGGGRRRAPT